MDNWTDIKNKILFSHMGCDWISIRVSETSVENIKNVLKDAVNLYEKEPNSIYNFELGQVSVVFYNNSDQHFDFDPKEVLSENQWTTFLDFFKSLSRKLNTKILFRPEDSNYKSEESILVQIFGDEIVYNFNIKADYDDNY